MVLTFVGGYSTVLGAVWSLFYWAMKYFFQSSTVMTSLSFLTFDSVQSAQRAKASLNGADIYSGCCTLKIEYAKVSPGSDWC